MKILEIETKLFQRVKEFRYSLVKKYLDLQMPEKYQPILDYFLNKRSNIQLDRELIQEMVDVLGESI